MAETYDTSGAVSVGQLETTVTKLKDYTDGKTVTVDDVLSTASTNPVQNKVVTARLNSLDNGQQECLTGLSVSGQTVTYTTMGGTTGTITTQDTVYTHPSYTKSSTTSTGTPAFGGTFTAIDSVTTNSTGHVTAVNTKTVTVPSTAATTTTMGLMSASDKAKLDGITMASDEDVNAMLTAVFG